MNVAEYFNEKFFPEFQELDESWNEMPVDSVCGEECVKAIDAGKLLIDHMVAAHGKYANLKISEIVDMVRGICDVYIVG